MINHISIRDFAIIKNTDVDFYSGLNIITGETGSGKSIVVTAISLALGSRADSSFVRFGTDKAIIELSGEIDGEEVIISRERKKPLQTEWQTSYIIRASAHLPKACRYSRAVRQSITTKHRKTPDTCRHLWF